jgi:hypothetical protein
MRERRCPYQYRHTPHEHQSGGAPAQCDGRPDAPQEPEGLPPGLLLKLTVAVSDVLDECPEHNTFAQHEHVVHEVVAAVLQRLQE